MYTWKIESIKLAFFLHNEKWVKLWRITNGYTDTVPIQIWGDYECKYGGNSHRDANTPVTCGICGIRPQPPTLHWRDNGNVTIFSRTLDFHLSLS